MWVATYLRSSASPPGNWGICSTAVNTSSLTGSGFFSSTMISSLWVRTTSRLSVPWSKVDAPAAAVDSWTSSFEVMSSVTSLSAAMAISVSLIVLRISSGRASSASGSCTASMTSSSCVSSGASASIWASCCSS